MGVFEAVVYDDSVDLSGLLTGDHFANKEVRSLKIFELVFKNISLSKLAKPFR